jgi:excisionase family DNA binding protein
MTTKEVAEMLRVHEKTVGQWRKRRNLPFKKNRRSVVFIRGDVLQWQAQQER